MNKTGLEQRRDAPAARPRQLMQPRLSSGEPAAARRGERIYLDVAVRSGEGRKKYTLLAVDEATGESFETSVSNLSLATASAFLKSAMAYFLRSGVETTVISDRSPMFCSPSLARAMRDAKLVLQYTAPHDPSHKGLIEKVLRTDVVDDLEPTRRSGRADLKARRK